MQYTHPNSNFNGQLDLGLPDFQTNPNVELVLGRRRVDGRQRKQAMSDPFFWDGVGWDVNAHIYIILYIYICTHTWRHASRSSLALAHALDERKSSVAKVDFTHIWNHVKNDEGSHLKTWDSLELQVQTRHRMQSNVSNYFIYFHCTTAEYVLDTYFHVGMQHLWPTLIDHEKRRNMQVIIYHGCICQQWFEWGWTVGPSNI